MPLIQLRRVVEIRERKTEPIPQHTPTSVMHIVSMNYPTARRDEDSKNCMHGVEIEVGVATRQTA